jgi:hypothetical protein
MRLLLCFIRRHFLENSNAHSSHYGMLHLLFASADCVVAQSREHRLGGDVLHDRNEAKMHGRETYTTEAHGQGKVCKRYGLKNLSYRGWYLR